jgi:hypothetical protein
MTMYSWSSIIRRVTAVLLCHCRCSELRRACLPQVPHKPDVPCEQRLLERQLRQWTLRGAPTVLQQSELGVSKQWRHACVLHVVACSCCLGLSEHAPNLEVSDVVTTVDVLAGER